MEHSPKKSHQLVKPHGFSVVELLVVATVMGVLLGIGLNFSDLRNPLGHSTDQVTGVLKQARARAMATTQAYRVRSSGNAVIVESAARCNETTWTPSSGFDVNIPADITFGSAWKTCFNARGIAQETATITLAFANNPSRQRTVSVFLGGGVKSQ
jgi:prepilin-type N-terminal cleavage/methylation domain-containing protein